MSAEHRSRWYAYYSEKRVVHQWQQVHMLKELDIEKVLEVGPYLGLVSAMMINAGYRVTTLDVAPEPRVPGVTRHIQGDVRNVTPERLMGHDVIVCCETLEHIPWSQVGDVLARFSASEVPWLLISVPYEGFQVSFSTYLNRYVWRKRSALKKFRFLTEFPAPAADGWEPHKWEIGYRGFTVPRLRNLVTEAGYDVRRQDFTAGCRSIFLLCRNMNR